MDRILTSAWGRYTYRGAVQEKETALSDMTKKAQSKNSKGDGSKKPHAAAGIVDRDLQAKIGAQLRSMHDDVIREGVPDRFRELLVRLDRSKAKD